MPNILRTYLPVFDGQLRTSVLGRAAGRKLLSPKMSPASEDDADEGEAVARRSHTTDAHIQSFFDAWNVGHESGLGEAMSRIVQSWRADNAAGGVPVHAHLPLPYGFAKALARLVSETSDDAATPPMSVSSKLDPGEGALVTQQLRHAMRSNAVGSSDDGEGHLAAWVRNIDDVNASFSTNTRFDRKRNDVLHSNGSVPHDARRLASRELGALTEGDSSSQRSLEYGGRQLAALHRDEEYGRGVPLQAPSLTPFGTPTGARGPLDEDIGEANDDADTLRPTSKSATYGPPWYTPGDWRKQRDPRSAGNSLLVGPERLSASQRKNLADRTWVFPTDGGPEYGPDGVNYPYFGARRSDGGPPTYHGGYDARFKKPAAGSNQKPDKRVVAATKARFLGFQRTDKYGNVINKVIFDLGDGLTLEMLHIEPTPEILAMDRQIKADKARADAARRAGRPVPPVRYPELDAGHPLGEVDALPGKKAHDHTHMQLITTVNGDRWTVDLTPYMERRARRYWRYPTNDWLERRYDDAFGQDLPPGL